MKLEDQVSNRELSEKLLYLGFVDQMYAGQGRFYWVYTHSKTWALSGPNLFHKDIYHSVRAFTVAELGEMLPLFETGRSGKRVQVRRYKGQSWCFQRQDGDTEANARAKMLIYLTERGIVKP